MLKNGTKVSALLLALALLGASEARAQAAKDVDCIRCIETGDIAKKAVTKNKIEKNAVTGRKIKDGSVGLPDLSPAVDQVITDLDDRVTGLETAPSALNFVVRDANGDQVGTVLEVAGRTTVWVAVTGAFGERDIQLEIHPAEIPPTGAVFFDQTGCTGNAYVQAQTGFPPTFDGRAIRKDGDVRELYVATSDVFTEVMTQSALSSTGCFDVDNDLAAFPADFHLADLHVLFPPPFTLTNE